MALPRLRGLAFEGFMRGEPLVAKMAVLAKYGVLPAAMAVACLYSPPVYSKRYAKKYNPAPAPAADPDR